MRSINLDSWFVLNDFPTLYIVHGLLHYFNNKVCQFNLFVMLRQ